MKQSSTYTILHVFDDAIISLDTIYLFLKLENYNQSFAIITSDTEKWDKIDLPLLFIKNNNNSAAEIHALMQQFDVIIMQALSYEKAKAIYKFNNKQSVIIWALWGYELYNIAQYFTKTELEFSTTINNKGILQKIKDYHTFNIIYKRAVQKIDISLFLLKEDFDLLSRCIPNSIIWKEACYQTVNNLIGENSSFKSTGNSILIGNSSTPSNRHEIAFNQLSKLDLSDRKIIVPLSYGDNEYREKVLTAGKLKFGNEFKPLIEFMPRNNYSQLLSSCSHAIFAHERQQAFGSILTMLLGGAKVFLSRVNPLFNWFNHHKIIIFCLESDIESEIEKPLNDIDKQYNVEQLNLLLSEKRILNQLDDVLTSSLNLLKSKNL